MKRFLWASPILFVLMSTSVFANTIRIVNFPNGEPDWAFFDTGNNFNLFIDFGDVPPNFCVLCSPGSGTGEDLSGVGADDAFLTIGSNSYSLSTDGETGLQVTDITLSIPFFAFPTNGQQVFSITETATFSALVTILDTGQSFEIGGSAVGTMVFYLDPSGFYDNFGQTFTNTPEPGSLGLVITGVLSMVPLARRRRWRF